MTQKSFTFVYFLRKYGVAAVLVLIGLKMMLSIWFEISGGASPSPKKKNMGKEFHISGGNFVLHNCDLMRCDICPGHWDLQLGFHGVFSALKVSQFTEMTTRGTMMELLA